jgi:Peptidase family M23
MRLFFAVATLFLLPSGLTSGPEYPVNYFRSPLGIPLSLAGNFAEMRSNHFHAGLDIKTNGQTGYRVYAAGQAWISRIAVSPGGYGNALYLEHPNGYTTVYAHLDRFEGPIADFVKSAQYRNQSFRVNLFPEKGQFQVAKGDVIAYSGNSGSSGGPHLHFEIRDTATSEPLNPLLFGMPVVDETPPRIFRVKLYVTDPSGSAAVVSAAGDTLSRARFRNPATIPVSRLDSGQYQLGRGAHIAAEARIAFGVQAHDYHDGSQSRLGLYTASLEAGEQEIYRSTMERINFSTTRYINAHLDYAERSNSGRWVQRSHLLPGNRLPLYQTVRRGYLDISPGDELPMQYTVADAYGNEASLSFSVSGVDLPDPPLPAVDGYLLSYSRAESFVVPGLIVRLPRGSLYEDLELDYSTSDGPAGAFSAVHRIHRPSTPIQTAITVSIEATELPERLQRKALLARVVSGKLRSSGGGYENGYVTAQTRAFGSYVIAVDTVAPAIRPDNIQDGASMARSSSIRLRISDEFSGIRSYEGRIDGEWVLFEHDAKRSLISYTFDERVGRGRHELTVRVTDGKGNVESYRAGFTR